MGGGGSKQTIIQHLKTSYGLKTGYESTVKCGETGDIQQGSNIHSVGPISGNSFHLEAGMTASCDARDTVELLANTNITNDQFTEIKSKIKQEGLNFFNIAVTDQNLKKVLESEISIDDVKKIYRECQKGGDIRQWSDWSTHGDVLNNDVYNSAYNDMQCMLTSDTATKFITEVDNKQRGKASSEIDQKGIKLSDIFLPLLYIVIAVIAIFAIVFFYRAYNRRQETLKLQQPRLQQQMAPVVPVAQPVVPVAQPVAQVQVQPTQPVKSFGESSGLSQGLKEAAMRTGAKAVAEAAGSQKVQGYVGAKAAEAGGPALKKVAEIGMESLRQEAVRRSAKPN